MDSEESWYSTECEITAALRAGLAHCDSEHTVLRNVPVPNERDSMQLTWDESIA